MKRWLPVLILGLTATVSAQGPLALRRTIPLPGVEGRVDHLAVDERGQRLFVAALGNNSLEVVDLHAGKRLQSVTGLAEPQGAAYDPATGRLFVANGGSGALDVFEGNPTLRRVQSVALGGDADNVRLSADGRRVFVGCRAGALAVLDARDGRHVGEIPLPAHPESFQVESAGARIFVNLPRADQIAVVDREKGAVAASWPLALIGAHANFPLALDEAGRRLFVGCRAPPRTLIYDTASGQRTASLEIGADADDLFYDAKRRQLYVSCGGGSLEVWAEDSPARFHLAQRVPTAPGARTSLFVPALDLLCVAVPRRGEQGTEIRVYQLP